MLVHHRVNNGIVGDCDFPPNIELLGQAHAFGVEIPSTFHPAVFDKKLLRNDFKKYSDVYSWCPDLQRLSLAHKALKMQYQPFLMTDTYTRRSEERV